MIHDIDIQPFHMILIMSQSKYKFYLSGSRYLGKARWDSDWDFYTAYNSDIREWLQNRSFERKSMKPEWFDLNTRGVYRHKNIALEIALVNSPEHKRMGLVYLAKHPSLQDTLKLPGYDRQVIWNHIYQEIGYVHKNYHSEA